MRSLIIVKQNLRDRLGYPSSGKGIEKNKVRGYKKEKERALTTPSTVNHDLVGSSVFSDVLYPAVGCLKAWVG